MTVTPTYNNDLSRVQLLMTDLADGSYLVEKSTNQLFWNTVRGGIGIMPVGGSVLLDDYEFAVNVENFYRITPLDPGQGLFLPSSGTDDYADTPDHASLDITGDIDIRADFTVDDPATGIIQYIVAKWDFSVNERSYTLRLDGAGNVELAWSSDGSNVLVAQSTIDIEGGVRARVRATLDVNTGIGTQHRARFYTSDSMDGPWLLVDDLINPSGTGSTSIFSSTASLDAGAADTGAGEMAGVIHAAEVYDGIGGTLVADPDFAGQPNGTTSFVDGTGKTWTLQGNAIIIGVESASITPMFESCEVWLKSIRYPAINQEVDISDYSPLGRDGRSGVYQTQNRSFPSATLDVATAFGFDMIFVTDTAEQARKLDLSLAVGDIFYLQLAPDGNPKLPPKSMYVIARGTSIDRLGEGEKRHLRVSFAEMAKPSPRVIGATLIWGTVFQLYGDWDSLLNANPTWNDLLTTVGSVDDLVVM